MAEFCEIAKLLSFEEVQSADIDESNMFFDKTVVITGAFDDFSRDELGERLKSFGAKVTTSVSKKTDFVLCGEKAGSKLSKAKELNVRVIEQAELLKILEKL